jgi:hypothetical protein
LDADVEQVSPARCKHSNVYALSCGLEKMQDDPEFLKAGVTKVGKQVSGEERAVGGSERCDLNTEVRVVVDDPRSNTRYSQFRLCYTKEK